MRPGTIHTVRCLDGASGRNGMCTHHGGAADVRPGVVHDRGMAAGAPSGPGSGARRTRPRWLYVHAGVVGVLIALFIAAVLGEDPDGGANIGAGLVGLPILALGLPWTLPQWIYPAPYDALPRALWYVVTLGPAVLNVALHAALGSAGAGSGGREIRSELGHRAAAWSRLAPWLSRFGLSGSTWG